MKIFLHILFFFLVCIGNGLAQAVLLPIGSSSGNSYGGFVANKHTFSYNPELNLLVFGHRGGGAAGGTLNEINFDYSTDNGATWVPQTAMPNPNTAPQPAILPTYLTRYPQMCIWNPVGNTDITNAKAVATGPCSNGTNWQGSYLGVADLPTGANTNYTFIPVRLID